MKQLLRLPRATLISSICAALILIFGFFYTHKFKADPTVSYPLYPTVGFYPENGSTDHIIPFNLNGFMFVGSSFGRRSVYSIFDTGSVYASCPADYVGNGTQWGSTQSFGDGLRSVRPARICILPRVLLPNCELRNCLVTKYDRLPGETDWEVIPIVPGAVFRDMILTIDYRHSRLIAHQDVLMDTLDAPPYPENGLGKPVWLPLVPISYNGFGPYPVVKGNVNNIEVNIVIDTASPGGIWILNRSLFPRFKHISPTPDAIFMKVLTTGSGKKMTWRIGGISGMSPVVLHPKPYMGDTYRGIDASVGNATLRNYRITIDYPNKRVCFERYL